MTDTSEDAAAALFPLLPNLSWDLYVCGYKNNFIRRVLETVGAVFHTPAHDAYEIDCIAIVLLSLVITVCNYSLGCLFRNTTATTWPVDAIGIQARDFSSFPRPCACAQVSRRGAQASGQARQRDRASAGRGIWQLAFLQKEEAAAAGGSGSSSSRKATTKREIDGGTGLWVTGVGGRSVTANHTRFQ